MHHCQVFSLMLTDMYSVQPTAFWHNTGFNRSTGLGEYRASPTDHGLGPHTLQVNCMDEDAYATSETVHFNLSQPPLLPPPRMCMYTVMYQCVSMFSVLFLPPLCVFSNCPELPSSLPTLSVFSQMDVLYNYSCGGLKMGRREGYNGIMNNNYYNTHCSCKCIIV